MVRLLAIFLSLFLLLIAMGSGGGLLLLWHIGRNLPDYSQLADYRPSVMTRVHAGDGSLISEFARERRLFVPATAIPQKVINAFLSAEDKTFYSHPGIDFAGIATALIRNVLNILVQVQNKF